MRKKALFIGNSDGIGLAVTRELLKRQWSVIGISRSESPIKKPSYRHIVSDVRDAEYPARVKDVLKKNKPPDLCVYCVGVGEMLDLSNMDGEIEIFKANLLAMVETVSCVIPVMVKRGNGHFIGLSSLADEMLSPEAPSYHATKAAFSNYLEGLALAIRPKGVYISNVRLGFVDTKMAKGDLKPFMMSVDRAAGHLLACIKEKPIRYTAPWIMIPLVKLRKWMLRLSILTRDFL